MNTVDALKNLYKTLAGKDYAGDPNPTDAEMIDAIAKDAQSGGSGGGDEFEINLAYGPDGNPLTFITDVTFEEILDAVITGKSILISRPITNEKKRAVSSRVSLKSELGEVTAVAVVSDIFSVALPDNHLVIEELSIVKEATSSPATVNISYHTISFAN